MKTLFLVGAILVGAATASHAGVNVSIRFGVLLPPAPVIIRHAAPVCPPRVVVAPPICPPRVIVPCPPPSHYRYGYRHGHHGHGRDQYRRHDGYNRGGSGHRR